MADANGQPKANAKVSIKQSSGITRHVRTDATGHYAAFYIPQGTTTVSSSGMSSVAYVGAAGAEVDLQQARPLTALAVRPPVSCGEAVSTVAEGRGSPPRTWAREQAGPLNVGFARSRE